MIRFANENILWFLILIPFLILFFYYSRYIRKKDIKKLGKSNIVETLIPEMSSVRTKFKFWLTIFALLLLIIAASRPQVGAKIEKAKRKGVELIICLDISNSMLANDISPNRLERAKMAIMQLIKKLDNDKIGVIVFAGKPFVQLPLTDDYGAAMMFADRITTNLIEQQGTAIGSAIDLAVESFPETKNIKYNRAIIVISDGENHEDDAIAAAANAWDKKIKVHTIGIGNPDGTPIPVIRNGQIDFKKDTEGNIVITKLNEQNLQDIANASKSVYIRASNNNFGLDKIFDEIAKMEKVESEAVNYSDYEDRFYFFAALSLIILLIELSLRYKKSYISQKLKLFTKKHID